MKDLYAENYKTLIKDTEDDSKKWKDSPCSSIGRISLDKMVILPKAIYRINAIPIKLPMTFFTELEQIILKCIWNHKRLIRITKSNPEEKEQSWRHNHSRVQTIPQSYGNLNNGILAQNRHMDRWNRIESLHIKPTHLQSIKFGQRRQECTMEKRQSLQQVALGKLDCCM